MSLERYCSSVLENLALSVECEYAKQFGARDDVGLTVLVSLNVAGCVMIQPMRLGGSAAENLAMVSMVQNGAAMLDNCAHALTKVVKC